MLATTVNTRTLAAAALLILADQAMAGDRRYDFEVLLDTHHIGTHRFDIASRADGTDEVRSEADFVVRFLGLPVYRYRHRATERWSAGCLQYIVATTNDNGRQQEVSGGVQQGRFQLEQPTRSIARAGCVNAFAYWDPARLLMQAELLNPQSGEFERVKIAAAGEETLKVRGAAVLARRYELRGDKLVIDLWYSAAGEWLQLESRVASNQVLRYRLR